MLSLEKKVYPLEYVLGLNEILFYFVDSDYINEFLSLQIIIFCLKYKIEGLRVSIFIYALGKILFFLTGSTILNALINAYFVYFAHGLVVFELPQGGPEVGHMWFQNGWIRDYGLDQLAIYYPATITNEKPGITWLKCSNYAQKMNDTAKKDIRRKRRAGTPYFFFQVVATQFYKIRIYVYPNAALRTQQTYPVIVLSHGLASHCDGYSVIARYLAQQGYIVFCPEHLEHIRNILPSDEENRVYRLNQLNNRFRIIQRTLDVIYDKERFNSIFKQEKPNTKITPDYSDINIIGHSFGGSTAIFTSVNEHRITGACVAYDPVRHYIHLIQCLYLIDPNLCPLDTSDLKVPILCINAEDFYKRLYSFMDNDRRLVEFFSSINKDISDHCTQLYLKDQQHADFSDIPIIWNGESGLYNISRNVHQIHLRFSIILELTRVFLLESREQRKKSQSGTNGMYQKQDLRQVLLESASKISEDGKNLIRWEA